MPSRETGACLRASDERSMTSIGWLGLVCQGVGGPQIQHATELASFHPGSKQGQETHASGPSVKKETRNSIDLDTLRPKKLAGKI